MRSDRRYEGPPFVRASGTTIGLLFLSVTAIIRELFGPGFAFSVSAAGSCVKLQEATTGGNWAISVRRTLSSLCFSAEKSDVRVGRGPGGPPDTANLFNGFQEAH